MKVGQILEINVGPLTGRWVMTHSTGFGSSGKSAHFQKLGKRGQILRNDSINLTKDQIKKVIANEF